MAGLYISTVYGPKSTVARLDKIKDIGVYFDAKLDFKYHMHEKINEAYMMLGLINRNVKHMTIPTISLSISSSVQLKVKVLLEFHAEHRSSLHVYPQLSPVSK